MQWRLKRIKRLNHRAEPPRRFYMGIHSFIKDYIYKLVTATSELEARGNLIFTYAVLRCNEGEAFIPAKMFRCDQYPAYPTPRLYATP
jgi:hypothetical protein